MRVALILFVSSVLTGFATPGQVLQQIEALQDPDVAWRKIPWRTCLLDGLEASRESGKPLMLWIFIDRPFDDTRC